MDRIKLVCTVLFIAYGVLLSLFISKCVKTSENSLKIEAMEREYEYKLQKDEYKSNLPELKRSYFEYLYKN